MGYIFMTDIHGVGKTTLIRKLQKEIKLSAYSVSDLIRSAGNNIDTSEKNTGNISGNQELWKKQLLDINVENNAQLLLDGHCCLLDKNGNIYEIPQDTFKDTDLNKIILIKNNPEVIVGNLWKRDNKEYEVEFIKKFQKCEEECAIKLSETYHVPLFVYDNINKYGNLKKFIIEE